MVIAALRAGCLFFHRRRFESGQRRKPSEWQWGWWWKQPQLSQSQGLPVYLNGELLCCRRVCDSVVQLPRIHPSVSNQSRILYLLFGNQFFAPSFVADLALLRCVVHAFLSPSMCSLKPLPLAQWKRNHVEAFFLQQIPKKAAAIMQRLDEEEVEAVDLANSKQDDLVTTLAGVLNAMKARTLWNKLQAHNTGDFYHHHCHREHHHDCIVVTITIIDSSSIFVIATIVTMSVLRIV